MWTAYPAVYAEKDTELGLTAEGLNVSVMCTTEEWTAIRDEFNAWRDARLQDEVYDEDEEATIREIVGSTVTVSAKTRGVEWVDRECYFLAAPQAEDFGSYLQVTFELVDAAQWVQCYNREKEVEKADEVVYCGTFTLWGTVLKLRKPPESYQDMPSLTLSAGGKSYTTGPRVPTETRVLEGDTDKAGWNSIYSNCGLKASALPSSDWFPVTSPSASVTKRVTAGIRNDLYTVSITVAAPQA
jgi:hypothetical protein